MVIMSESFQGDRGEGQPGPRGPPGPPGPPGPGTGDRPVRSPFKHAFLLALKFFKILNFVHL